MKSLVYLSESLTEFSDSDVEELAHYSCLFNRQIQVTGYLYFSESRFIQYLEGEASDVDKVMKLISQDPRHEILYQVELNNVEDRLFPSWSMRHVRKPDRINCILEHLIESNLLHLKNDSILKERRTKLLWDHVTAISKLQHLQPLNSPSIST